MTAEQNGASYDVVVVGAGAAGLAAARSLREAGRSVLIVEARDRIGGRLFHGPLGSSGFDVELGGTWVNPARQPHIAQAVERYDLALSPGVPPVPIDSIWHLGGKEYRGALPFPMEEIHALDRLIVALTNAAARLDLDLPFDEQPITDLDISAREFFDGLDLPPAAADFVTSHLSVWKCSSLADMSLLNVLISVRGFDTSPSAYYTAMTNRLAAGTGALCSALLEDAAPDLWLSSSVRGVAEHPDDVLVTMADGRHVRAAALVLTAPVNTWAAIDFSPGLNEHQRSVASSGHVGRMNKVWALVEGLPSGISYVRSRERGPLSWLLSQEILPDGSQLVAGFSVGDDGLDLSDRSGVLDAFNAALPIGRAVDVGWHDWNTDPYSRGAWAVYAPGQRTRHWSGLRRPTSRLVFAGADIADGGGTWIDAALGSGYAAAEAALARCERRRVG